MEQFLDNKTAQLWIKFQRRLNKTALEPTLNQALRMLDHMQV